MHRSAHRGELVGDGLSLFLGLKPGRAEWRCEGGVYGGGALWEPWEHPHPQTHPGLPGSVACMCAGSLSLCFLDSKMG